MFQMAIGTCQFAKSLSVFSHFKCYIYIYTPYPTVQRNSSDLGDSHKWPWSGLGGGSGPLDPPPSAAPAGWCE